MHFLNQPDIARNLAIMSYLWAAAAFSTYLLYFYIKYLPGGLYQNAIALSLASIVGSFSAGYIIQKTSIKTAMTILMGAALLGALLILFVGERHQELMPVFIVITKVGSSGFFTCCYQATVDVFPTLFRGTAFGICNFIARFLTTFAPILAEIQPPTPMILTSLITLVGIFAI